MAEPTVPARLYKSLSERIDQTAANERRTKQEVLAMLIEDGFAFREMTRAKVLA